MNKSKELVENARTWLGTKWMHNQRIKGVGVDCVNFLMGVAFETGLNLPELEKVYTRLPFKDEIKTYLSQNLIKKDDLTFDIGNIILYNFDGYNCHVAIATSDHTIIHATNRDYNRVIEHPVDGIWLRKINSVWEIKWD